MDNYTTDQYTDTSRRYPSNFFMSTVPNQQVVPPPTAAPMQVAPTQKVVAAPSQIPMWSLIFIVLVVYLHIATFLAVSKIKRQLRSIKKYIKK